MWGRRRDVRGRGRLRWRLPQASSTCARSWGSPVLPPGLGIVFSPSGILFACEKAPA